MATGISDCSGFLIKGLTLDMLPGEKPNGLQFVFSDKISCQSSVIFENEGWQQCLIQNAFTHQL